MNYTKEKLDVAPWFDMEMFLSLSQEKRFGGALMDRCLKLWDKWATDMDVQRLDVGKRQYLLVRLGDVAGEDVDEAWNASPADGFVLNALAQTLCMSAINTLLPEIQEAGCAPAPKPTDELADALTDIGVPYKEDGPTLAHRYAVLTYFPFKGGCEICTLQKNCPKGQSATDCSSSFVLPGYEPLT